MDNNEKIRKAIVETLINIRDCHDLSDSEIDGMSQTMAAVCGFNRALRDVFYRSVVEKVNKDIKEEFERQKQEILSEVDEDKREAFDEAAREEADKILNKKNVVN